MLRFIHSQHPLQQPHRRYSGWQFRSVKEKQDGVWESTGTLRRPAVGLWLEGDKQTKTDWHHTLCHLWVQRERGGGRGGREQNGFLWAASRARAGHLACTTSGLKIRGTGTTQSGNSYEKKKSYIWNGKNICIQLIFALFSLKNCQGKQCQLVS